MKQEIKQSIEDRNRDIVEHFARTGKSYSQVAQDMNVTSDIVHAVLTNASVKGVVPKTNINHSWFEEPEMIEIPVKVSLISGKIVHFIPSRMNFE